MLDFHYLLQEIRILFVASPDCAGLRPEAIALPIGGTDEVRVLCTPKPAEETECLVQ